MSRSFAAIASSASSHDTRRHLPSASFIGVFSRRSLLVVSRAAAPFAQWPPRLIGDSKAASWRVQTPLSTVALIEQPTAQKGQIVRFVSIVCGVAPDAVLIGTIVCGCSVD